MAVVEADPCVCPRNFEPRGEIEFETKIHPRVLFWEIFDFSPDSPVSFLFLFHLFVLESGEYHPPL